MQCNNGQDNIEGSSLLGIIYPFYSGFMVSEIILSEPQAEIFFFNNNFITRLFQLLISFCFFFCVPHFIKYTLWYDTGVQSIQKMEKSFVMFSSSGELY